MSTEEKKIERKRKRKMNGEMSSADLKRKKVCVNIR